MADERTAYLDTHRLPVLCGALRFDALALLREARFVGLALFQG